MIKALRCLIENIIGLSYFDDILKQSLISTFIIISRYPNFYKTMLSSTMQFPNLSFDKNLIYNICCELYIMLSINDNE